MCGIAGLVHFDGRPAAESEIERLTTALAHRGRDSARCAVGGAGRPLSAYPGVALGHRRLSVIDLSPQSDQPMTTASGGTWIVYNGELFNYRAVRQQLQQLGHTFRTESDSEVVLVAYEQWGDACLTHFNGMFAFALWSESTRSLFCARDPLGIKPFYYTHDATGFQFASESQALVGHLPLALDPQALASYILSMYVPRQMSLRAGVRKLLPGHCLRVTPDGRVQERAYWQLPATATRTATAEDAAVELQAHLDRAVAAQLQSDVPVGALLSGGFDSGMIVAAAARAGQTIHTYSVGFDSATQADELPIARDLARRYGTIHHERVIAAGEVMDMLDRAISHMSEPVADSAIVPTYCLAGMAADDGVKVLLSGTGGDEVFAGYSRYVGSSWRRRLVHGTPARLRQALGQIVWPHSPLGARLRHPSLDMVLYTGGSVALAGRLFESPRAYTTFLEWLAREVFPATPRGATGLYEAMAFDLQVYLPDLLLMLLDQLTMAHTVEGRVPLLDVDLIAASYSLPAELHAHPGRPETRKLMRRMAVGQLDERTLTGRKQGFSGPVRSWIAANRARFRDRIMDLRGHPMLESLPIEQLWAEGAEHQNPFWPTEVFSLYCFSTWWQAHAGR